jgi:hypothetical protein
MRIQNKLHGGKKDVEKDHRGLVVGKDPARSGARVATRKREDNLLSTNRSESSTNRSQSRNSSKIHGSPRGNLVGWIDWRTHPFPEPLADPLEVLE